MEQRRLERLAAIGDRDARLKWMIEKVNLGDVADCNFSAECIKNLYLKNIDMEVINEVQKYMRLWHPKRTIWIFSDYQNFEITKCIASLPEEPSLTYEVKWHIGDGESFDVELLDAPKANNIMIDTLCLIGLINNLIL